MRMTWLLLGLGIGALIGWQCAHLSIAVECERLGGFFVGKQIFRCVEVKNVD